MKGGGYGTYGYGGGGCGGGGCDDSVMGCTPVVSVNAHIVYDAVETVGPEAFVFSSDFPHEVNVETCRHEVEEILANDALSDDAKQAIFYRNAERFYGLSSLARV